MRRHTNHMGWGGKCDRTGLCTRGLFMKGNCMEKGSVFSRMEANMKVIGLKTKRGDLGNIVGLMGVIMKECLKMT